MSENIWTLDGGQAASRGTPRSGISKPIKFQLSGRQTQVFPAFGAEASRRVQFRSVDVRFHHHDMMRTVPLLVPEIIFEGRWNAKAERPTRCFICDWLPASLALIKLSTKPWGALKGNWTGEPRGIMGADRPPLTPDVTLQRPSHRVISSEPTASVVAFGISVRTISIRLLKITF